MSDFYYNPVIALVMLVALVASLLYVWRDYRLPDDPAWKGILAWIVLIVVVLVILGG